MGAIDPLSLLHACHQRLLHGQLPRPCPHWALPQTELWQRGHPPLLADQGTPGASPCWRLEGMGRRIWLGLRGWEVVGTQLYSLQVRILISWTERQTDGLCIPFSLTFQVPQGLSASVILGSCRRGHRLQVPGTEKPGPCFHIHTQASMYRDTPTQTCTSTHKHAPMPINTHAHTQTCTVLHAASASWHHWVSIQWGLWERVSHHSHNCRLSLHSSPGLAERGAGAGRSKNSEHESRILRMQQSFLPSPLCQRCSLCPYPSSPPSIRQLPS